MTTLKIALAQFDFGIAFIEDNLKKHIKICNDAKEQGADIILFPELSLTGYPPEDLLSRKEFLDLSDFALKSLTAEVTDIYAIVGHPWRLDNKLYNACSVIHKNKILATYAKQNLPNYGVFDEKRYFSAGKKDCIIKIKNIPVGIVICEDTWLEGPAENVAKKGAKIILTMNASPFETEKHERRLKMLTERCSKVKIPIVYVNGVGGQDDIVFDGGSMAINANGEIIQHAGFFREILLPIEFTLKNEALSSPKQEIQLPNEEAKVYAALVLSLRDYIHKNKLPGAILGLSGGIDSALTLCLAVDALGADKVEAWILPSHFTAEMSITDAELLAKNLSVKTTNISIEPMLKTFSQSLKPYLSSTDSGLPFENLQARIRAILLMARANETGYILISTSNRSESAVGYTTLYGDMCGGFAILKDVPKTLVYRLAHYRNQNQRAIPDRIIDRAPSAELALDQKDEDNLPPYPILDKILQLYLNETKSIDEIIHMGFNQELVTKVVHLIKLNEYKRRQAPIGPRINLQAFGRDRRYPITSGF